ncbi:MAG TPA: pitrilysin family protein [Bacteroidales bacterium]|nr:pitrilysin family protein [Bacteroidales bacterium]HPJ03956.1 pitrilysin family protein [Bacteroidales bacterium]HPQ62583.1 pitrilysin family protein [Bacteroidales bacterium]HRW26348.1 pitrilysin family protein [Bacteroidales bacterium]
MKKLASITFVVTLLLLAGCSGKEKTKLTVPHETYKLDNGLTVVLNEDKSDPIASLVILYHVGSAREVPGKTGFAHLFEHMMFQRSENVGEDECFKYIEGAGGDMNGGTSFDQTIYFELIPKNALELAMWLESDRMGFLRNTVTPQSFALQQNVVQNEKRQGVDNRPYGHTDAVILKNLYPEGHPYSWDVIGEMEDLANATVDDVKEFHKKFYIPNNATLVVSGDFEAEEVKALIEKYFGEIPAGEELKDPEPLTVTLAETKKLYHEDAFARAPQFTMVYPVAEQFTKDSYALDVLAQLLGVGKNSPLYKVLVKEKQLTSNVRIYNQSQEIAGQMQINVTANPSTSLDEVEKAVFEAFERFETEKFTERDLERIKAGIERNFYLMMSSVMYKGFMLALYTEFTGSPDFMLEELEMQRQVTADDVWDVYNRYIKGKNYVATSFVPRGQTDLVAAGSVDAGVVEEDITQATQMEVVAGGEEVIEKTPSSFDRSVAPVPGPDPSVTLPEIWKSETANGMKIFGISQSELPLLTYSIVIEGGHLLDDPAKPGVARFTAQMLNEGTKNRTPEELEEEIQLLGAIIDVGCSDERITISVNTLSRNFEKTLSLVEEMLLEPRWDEEQFSLNKTRTINNLKRNLADPGYVASAAFNKIVLGADNILSTDASGTVESVETITLEDLKSFYEKYISPSSANFLIVGDIDQARVDKALKGLGERWSARDVVMPELIFPPVPEKSTMYFVDIPGAKQSVINIGNISLPRTHPDYFKANVANYLLGGGASAKLFMVLREEKGFTYGAYSNFNGQKHYGTFRAYASVRSDATLESVELFRDIMAEYRKGVTQETVDFTRGSLLKANALRFETIDAKLGMLNTMTFYGLPEDYISQEEDYLRGLTIDQVNETLQKYIDPMKMHYVVTGDGETQMKGLKAVGFGEPVPVN